MLRLTGTAQGTFGNAAPACRGDEPHDRTLALTAPPVIRQRRIKGGSGLIV